MTEIACKSFQTSASSKQPLWIILLSRLKLAIMMVYCFHTRLLGVSLKPSGHASEHVEWSSSTSHTANRKCWILWCHLTLSVLISRTITAGEVRCAWHYLDLCLWACQNFTKVQPKVLEGAFLVVCRDWNVRCTFCSLGLTMLNWFVALLSGSWVTS